MNIIYRHLREFPFKYQMTPNRLMEVFYQNQTETRHMRMIRCFLDWIYGPTKEFECQYKYSLLLDTSL